jgi:acetylglutamate kinase
VKVLVKLGGTLLDTVESRDRLAGEIADASQGVQMVVVHGGGKQMTRFLEERGVESQFVEGLRVSGPEVMDAVLKVFAGSVNHQLVASLVKAGSKAVGLTGIDAGLTESEVLDSRLGAVGRVIGVEPQVLEVLVSHRLLPVVACVGGDRNGGIYNVNADQMAVALAKGFKADALWFLTDVEGVRGEGGVRIPTLTPALCDDLIAKGIATGGMLAKLRAATDALAGGVGRVIIAPGAQTGILAMLKRQEAIGTAFVPEGEGHHA